MDSSDPTSPLIASQGPRFPVRGDQIPFFVGVAGSMRLRPEDLPVLRLRIRAIFEWLRAPAVSGSEKARSGNPQIEQIYEDLAAAAASGAAVSPAVKDGWTGLGLKNTPVILLTGMAPGADQLVFEVASSLEGSPGIRIEVPLPFPESVMPVATTYTALKRPEGAPEDLPWRGADILEGLACYRVECAGDREAPPSDAAFRRMASAADDADRIARRRRYRAVGEFIAVHSDLLIALDDELDDGERPDPAILVDLTRCGTEVIIQAKRLGPTHGLLPIPPALDWSDNGPVFHLQTDRRKAPVGALTVLFPYECTKEAGDEDLDAHKMEDAHPSRRKLAEREGWRLLRSLAGSLEHVNELELKPGRDNDKPVLPTARPRLFRGPLQSEGVPSSWVGSVARVPEVVSDQGRFRRFLAFRQRIRQFTDRTDDMVKALRRRLLMLGLLAVALLQVAEEWKPTVPAAHSGAHGGAQAMTFDPQVLRSLAALGTVVILFWALFTLRRQQAKLWAWVAWIARRLGLDVPDGSAFERMEDCRAVAEGLRVQFAWSAAGVGESVSANYLQRARGDLRWIRAAISSHAFPYETDREAFLGLSRAEQRSRLRSVVWGWVYEQRTYFAQRAEQFTRWRIRSHSLATALATSGAVGVFWPLLEHLAHEPAVITWMSPQAGVLIAAVCLMAYTSVLAWFGVHVQIWDYWWSRVKKVPDDGAIPPFPLSPSEQGRLHRLLDLGHVWWAPTLLGLGFGMGMVAALRSLPAGSWHPAHGPAISIFKALCLAGAGYLHLDAAWRFLTENIHRYVGMHRVYQRTGDRLEMLLDRMETADQAGRIDEHDRLGAEVHDLLGTLGRDALDENSDWFVLHRTHPVAPINLH